MRHRDESLQLIEVSRRYADQGLALPRNLAGRLGRLVRPYTLADLDPHGTAEGLVGAWLATRDNSRSESKDEVWLILLRIFYSRFAEPVPGVEAVLRSNRMNLKRTRVEVRLKLASRCFFVGRSLGHRDKESPAARFVLDECVRVSREVLPAEDTLPEHTRRKLRGHLANALTIMSRTVAPDAAITLLTEAEEHATAAEQFGDRSDEHFAYRIETALRFFTLTQDRTHLERARDMILTAGEMRSKRLRANAADSLFQLALLHTEAGNRGVAIQLLNDSEHRYCQALAAPPDREDGVDDGYLLAKRAQVRNRLYRLGDDHGRRDSRLLDDALADWLDERAEPHRHNPSVVRALLDRARVLARRNDSPRSRSDRELARRLLTSEASDEIQAKLQAAELEEMIEEASAADDLERLETAATEITRLAPDAPIPTAALARAGKILAAKLPEERWRPLLLSALDRIEVDLVHPSLTGPATRHVAGHAALLAWLLGRRTHDVELLGRAVQLYRTSFDASDAEPPSVDALVNAGACALQLGKNIQAGDEEAAEEASSLFAEGLTWLQAGLARARSGSTAIREDFDPVTLHSRLGELALRLYPFTWDANLLDTAIEHLTTARELGEQALRTHEKGLQLTGLLGDAHYRRGVAENAAQDLYQAIGLKDLVYQTGTERRENRSLTAAASLRLSRLTSDDRLLADAARRALQAAHCDPAWPWPVLQLGELAAYADRLDEPGLATTEPRDLASLVVAGRQPELLRRAAELAVHNEEFEGSILGGQPRAGEHGVRVLKDHHRLLEQAIVLKRLGHADAHREHAHTVRFREWLDGVGAPGIWTLPEPLAVVDLADGDSVYVMRRAQARLLGASVVSWRTGSAPDPHPRFRAALRYLAAFQAWRALSDNGFPRTCGPSEQETFRKQLTKVAGNLGADDELLRLLGAACQPFAAAGTPAVAKKDPHPGNWLWTRDDRLVLIDIESTDALPLLREAATVIDDLPLLDADDEGWHRRSALCGDYLDALAEFGLQIDDRDQLMARYEAMVALHTAKGLGRLRQYSLGISSFSLATARLESSHYGALLRYLGQAAIRRETRDLATHLLTYHAERL